MRQVFELIERVGPSDAAVTILGETGTGKELVGARRSTRAPPGATAPFIPVNCSAIAESLIESELFGHEKGAFSGAERMRKGAFEEADRGTIFLDEIGELPLDLQPKLLRVLELGEVKRVGASRPIHGERPDRGRHPPRPARAGARRDASARTSSTGSAWSQSPSRRSGSGRATSATLAEAFLAPRRAARRVAALDARRRSPSSRATTGPATCGSSRTWCSGRCSSAARGSPSRPARSPSRTPAPRPVDGGDDDTLYLRGLTLEEIEREAIRLSLRRNRGKRSAVVKELRIAKSTVMKRIGQWGLHEEGRGTGDAARARRGGRGLRRAAAGPRPGRPPPARVLMHRLLAARRGGPASAGEGPPGARARRPVLEARAAAAITPSSSRAMARSRSSSPASTGRTPRPAAKASSSSARRSNGLAVATTSAPPRPPRVAPRGSTRRARMSRSGKSAEDGRRHRAIAELDHRDAELGAHRREDRLLAEEPHRHEAPAEPAAPAPLVRERARELQGVDGALRDQQLSDPLASHPVPPRGAPARPPGPPRPEADADGGGRAGGARATRRA